MGFEPSGVVCLELIDAARLEERPSCCGTSRQRPELPVSLGVASQGLAVRLESLPFVERDS